MRGVLRSVCLILGGVGLVALPGGARLRAEDGVTPSAIKNVQESDGSPSCFGWQLLVSNGTLTDNADGTCTVTTGGGGTTAPAGSNGFLQYNSSGAFGADIDHQVSRGANPGIILGQLGDIRWNATDDDLEMLDDLNIFDDTGPAAHLQLRASTGDTWELTAENTGAFYLTNLTDAKTVFRSDGVENLYFPTLNCSANANLGKLTAAADGRIYCLDDATGSGGTNHNLLSATHSDAVAASALRGDLIVANSTPSWARFAVGAANTVLTANGTDPAWSNSPTLTALTLSAATPQLTFDATTGTDMEISLSGSTWSVADTTNNKQLLQFYSISGQTQMLLPQLANCTLKTVGGGIVVCGVDNTGGGGGGSPAGSGSEWQYRVDGSTFGAITGSSVSGANATLAGNLTLSATTPTLTWDNATGTDFEVVVSGSLFSIADTTSNKQLLQFYSISGTTQLLLPQQTNGYLRSDLSGIVTAGNNPREFVFPATAMEPLEAADSIPPLTKTTGVNIDTFSASFDATTDEGRKVNLLVPHEVKSSATITFVWVWFSTTATSGGVRWDVRTTARGADGTAWDGTLTTTAVTCTTKGTVNQLNVCGTTNTLSTLGWKPDDRITVMIYRDADHAADTMAGDAELDLLIVSVPRA